MSSLELIQESVSCCLLRLLLTTVAMSSLPCLQYFLDLIAIGLQFSSRLAKSQGGRIAKVVSLHSIKWGFFPSNFTQILSCCPTKPCPRMTAAHKSRQFNIRAFLPFHFHVYQAINWRLRAQRSQHRWHSIILQYGRQMKLLNQQFTYEALGTPSVHDFLLTKFYRGSRSKQIC